MKFQKVLVAIDDSPLCASVFAAALGLAQSNQAAMLLLYCLTAPEIASEPGISGTIDVGFPMGLVSNDYQAYETQQILLEKQIEEAQTALKQYSAQAMSQGVAAESKYEIGEAGHLLCEVAKDWGADLIVVGRRGLTGLTEALVGSVSNYVVHHAPCSVLVIQEVELEPIPQAVTDLSSVVINPSPI